MNLKFIQKNKFVRTLSFVAIFVFIFLVNFSPLIETKRANAQLEAVASALMVPVNDVINNLKETTFDQIAWSLAKIAVQQMTTSLVDWINSGFNGNPGFVTDPLGALQDIADQTLGQFIEGSDLELLCSPFQAQIKMALITNQRNHFQNQATCKLSDVLNNAQNYKNFVSFDFNSGSNQQTLPSWSDWYDVAVRPGGNLYSAYDIAQEELSIRISNQQYSVGKTWDWGQGLLSWRDCSQTDTGHSDQIDGSVNDSNCPIVTPGSVIASQLNHTLGLPQDTLVTADEFNEIISALLSQLTSQIFGAAGGLFGTSQPNSNFNGDSYINQLKQDSINNYNNTVGFSTANISSTIDTLSTYIAIKNQSIASVDSVINLEGIVPSACGASSSQATSASSTVTNVLLPMKTGLQVNVSAANTYITRLNQLKMELGAVPTSDSAGFSAIVSEYNDVVIAIQPDSLIPGAERERDVTLPGTLNPIRNSAQNTINACLHPTP